MQFTLTGTPATGRPSQKEKKTTKRTQEKIAWGREKTRRRKKYYKIIDSVLLIVSGLAGVIIFYLMFFLFKQLLPRPLTAKLISNTPTATTPTTCPA